MGIESAHSPDSDASPEWPPRLTSRVVVRDDGRVECTIQPADASAEELLTTWVSALDDSFVDVSTMR